MIKKLGLITVLLVSFGMTTGCASFGRYMKGLVGGKVPAKKRSTKKSVGRLAKKRNYKRTDHKTLQEASRLGAESGSLWIERGQGSYLFTQNTNRLIGDLVNVEIEGQAKKQIETKVSVIQDLIDRIMKQREERRMALAKRKEKVKQVRTTAAVSGSRRATAPPPPPPKAKKEQSKFDVKIVPSQITEVMKDGSYMVEGDQPFMIGKREYKLVVKGIVRQEDFDDQGISAETLLDPKFDIVTNRSKRK